MRSTAINLIIFISTVQFFLGWDLFIAYSYLIPLIPLNALYLSVSVGVVLVFLSIIACGASIDTRRGSRKYLFCTIFFTLFCFAAQLASVLIFYQATGVLTVQGNKSSSELTTANEIYYNNVMVSIYTACCTGCSLNMCNNALPYFNQTNTVNCNNGNNTCAFASYCHASHNNVTNGCAMGTSGLFPPEKIEEAYCSLLKTTPKTNGVFLVGPASVSSCGGGSPSVFVDDILAYLGKNYIYVLGVLAALCALQGVNLVTQIVLLEFSPGGRCVKKKMELGVKLNKEMADDI